MWARTTRIYGTPETMDRGIDYVRDEVWPAVRAMDGCIGMSMIVDRDSGLSITTTSWATEDALSACRAAVMPLREQGAAMMSPDAAPDVAEWEIAAMHRVHHADPGTCVRVAWSQVDPANGDQAIEGFRHGIMPQIEQMPGFVSCSLLVNRDTGLGVTSVAFESREAMDSTREMADEMRSRSMAQIGAELLDVMEFDLVLAHLDVPELV